MAKHGKAKGTPKAGAAPKTKEARAVIDPESYLRQTPVWRFSDFDWDGPWGVETCANSAQKLREHIEDHLASFETMFWADILKASGGKARGTNNHEISRDKFKDKARRRLEEQKVLADKIMSLRLDAGTRVYGVREGNCLRLLWFDPHHKDPNKCAYDYG